MAARKSHYKHLLPGSFLSRNLLSSVVNHLKGLACLRGHQLSTFLPLDFEQRQCPVSPRPPEGEKAVLSNCMDVTEIDCELETGTRMTENTKTGFHPVYIDIGEMKNVFRKFSPFFTTSLLHHGSCWVFQSHLRRFGGRNRTSGNLPGASIIQRVTPSWSASACHEKPIFMCSWGFGWFHTVFSCSLMLKSLHENTKKNVVFSLGSFPPQSAIQPKMLLDILCYRFYQKQPSACSAGAFFRSPERQKSSFAHQADAVEETSPARGREGDW